MARLPPFETLAPRDIPGYTPPVARWGRDSHSSGTPWSAISLRGSIRQGEAT